ncbi:beta-class carbonic anhydrase [Candidatus Stoquefichus sp. SB1]|jgi:carbonic anhydrase|uniref:beta-class carbonic anhydrase n=1 Tax=Candidatus Stoquefichus sp. SB1 TaxID=1658109 RepID=UPI00067E8FD7|nr:carbonic anhydrase [Candidatus Stoquefichus sp. SB1]
MINEILEYNRQFVKEKKYQPYLTSKYPDRKLAIITCMDTRLIELLPAALGIKNGDAKIIKNAGGMIVHPFGSAVRSLLIAIYELGVEDIMVIGHTDCGVQHIDVENMLLKMKNQGIHDEVIQNLQYCGIDFEKWLGGFDDVKTSVKESVDILKKHPLIPSHIAIHGFIMDSCTGALTDINK